MSDDDLVPPRSDSWRGSDLDNLGGNDASAVDPQLQAEAAQPVATSAFTSASGGLNPPPGHGSVPVAAPQDSGSAEVAAPPHLAVFPPPPTAPSPVTAAVPTIVPLVQTQRNATRGISTSERADSGTSEIQSYVPGAATEPPQDRGAPSAGLPTLTLPAAAGAVPAHAHAPPQAAYSAPAAASGSAAPGAVSDATPPLARPEDPELSAFGRAIREWGPVLIIAVVVAFVVRMFIVQAYHIPSLSMAPTLDKGDRVIVNRLSYQFSDISRGDVVVFAKPPNQPSDANDLIKRVIGLPGETVRFRDGNVYVDGLRVEETSYISQPDSTRPRSPSGIPGCAQEQPAADMCVVPQGTIFVMGDNRTGSQDSRVFGPIEIDTVVGRAFVRVWPVSRIDWL